MVVLFTEQHNKREYVKLVMFFMRHLAEENKRKPWSSSSSTYKNQWDELTHMLKLNPSPPLEKKRDKKGKEKVEPSTGCEKKRKLVFT